MGMRLDQKKLADAADTFLKNIAEAKLHGWHGKCIDALESIRRREHPLKARLKKLGVSQAEAGIFLGGRFQPTVNAWLNGTYDMPAVVEQKLEALCRLMEARKEAKR